MYNHVLYIFYWAINSLVLYITSSLLASDIVLSNYKFNKTESAIYAGFWVTFILWIVLDLLTARGFKFNNIIIYLLVLIVSNTLGFWIVARFSHLLGFGITSYQWAIMLGLIVSIIQTFSWRTSFSHDEKDKKKKK